MSMTNIVGRLRLASGTRIYSYCRATEKEHQHPFRLKMIDKFLPPLPISQYNVEFVVTQARDLIAKDRHLFTRQRTTSDPYAVAFLGLDQRLGRTPSCNKTLKPVWNTTFHCVVPNKRHARVPIDMKGFLGKRKSADDSSNAVEACGMILIKLYDHDDFTDDDMMGTLLVPIPAGRETFTSTQWYDVDNLFVHNAKGQVEVKITVTPEFIKRHSAKDYLPSTDTVGKWTGKLMGKSETVDEHNVVVETGSEDRKGYILTMLKTFSE